MDFEHSERSRDLQEQVEDIFTNDILPLNREWHFYVRRHETIPPFLADLQRKARSRGLWNLALPGPPEEQHFWQYGGAYRGGTVHKRQGSGGSSAR